MIKKAILFVDAEKTVDGVPVPLIKIGGVPLLKRIVLDARRAEIDEVFVVLDKPNAAIEEFIGRNGLGINLRLTAKDNLREEMLSVGDKEVLLLEADRLYDFRALASLGNVSLNGYKALISVDLAPPEVEVEPELRYTLNDGRVLEATSGGPAEIGAEVGAYVHTVQSLEATASLDKNYLDRQRRALVEKGQAAYFDIGNGFVQPINSREDVRKAERRILRYIWKETDGIHARLNKKLALPLIKLLLKTPVTPNMISLFGVFVSVASGYFFSVGSYYYSILGAVVAYLSSLLDHVDGSIARLKSMESSFGAYFESFCDYVFYFSFAVGVTLGLYNETGRWVYPALGLACFFGMVMSVITLTYQRKKFAKNPSQYAAQAHRKLEANAQNPIYKFGRTCYFVVRRPVMPYYLFIFAVLNLLPVVMVLAALGANLFWTIQLYSNRLFRGDAKV